VCARNCKSFKCVFFSRCSKHALVRRRQVPTAHGKADLTVYREAGKSLQMLRICLLHNAPLGARVVSILCADGVVCERASIDEVYLDVTTLANTIACSDFVTQVLPEAERGYLCIVQLLRIHSYVGCRGMYLAVPRDDEPSKPSAYV
jgi:hypothetical protein